MGPLPTDPGKHFAMELLDTQVFFGERSGIGPFVADVLESWILFCQGEDVGATI